eukprot:4680318-Pleurochrysis_carterae.AAC.2
MIHQQPDADVWGRSRAMRCQVSRATGTHGDWRRTQGCVARRVLPRLPKRSVRRLSLGCDRRRRT